LPEFGTDDVPNEVIGAQGRATATPLPSPRRPRPVPGRLRLTQPAAADQSGPARRPV